MRRPATNPALVLAALLAVAAGAAAAGEAGDWLRRMDRAFHVEDYDGVFSYLRRTGELGEQGDLSSFRIVHKVIDGTEHERLVYLDGAHREIVRVGDRVSCIAEPDDELHAIIGSPSAPYVSRFSPHFGDLGNHYDVRLTGEDRVAGRAAVRLGVVPLDDDRYAYLVWLDRATALPLRSELRDAGGATLEIFQFTALRTGRQVAARDLAPELSDSVVTSHPASAPAAAGPPSPWRARWVPNGFRMTEGVLRRGDAEGHVSTLLFSDGLATVSVFVEAAPPRAAPLAFRRGATAVHTRLTRDPRQRDHLVTVVGEVPSATVQRIAEGIHYDPGPDDGTDG